MAKNKPIDDLFISCKAIIAKSVSRLLPPHEVEDVVHETYVRVCKYQVKNEIREPKALMLKVARNIALDALKRSDRRLGCEFSEELAAAHGEPSYGVNTPDANAAADEEFAHFCEAVRLLPKQCRRVFVLKKVYGYSQKEIAHALSISENTVEKHIAKGIKHCMLHMKRYENAVRSTQAEFKANSRRKPL